MPLILITTVRWIARVAGALMLLTVLTIAIGEGYPNPLLLPLHEQVVSFYMLVMLIGILVAWKWPAQGGVMLVAGYLAFRGDEIMHDVPLRLFGFLDYFLLLGVLNLFVWWTLKRATMVAHSAVTEITHDLEE